MNAEIIGVGTELLLGQIANTNAQRISSALASIGVDVYFHSAVGDNLGRMVDVIAHALDRSDCVIITGGLGPTPDDITREGVAETLGVSLERDAALEQQVRDTFAALGREMPESNLRQADLPEGATPIPAQGTAPGFYVETNNKLIFALPGVPWEMQAMLASTVMPRLRERAGEVVTVSRQVLVIGRGESATHEAIADIVESQSNPTIAYLAGAGQVRIRITAKAKTESEALALIGPVEGEVRQRLGVDAVEYSSERLATAFGEMLRERELTIAAAESLTGGLIGSELTAVKGSSDFFLGSLVCYSTEAKRDVAGVDEAILLGPGPVSAEAAGGLAEGAARNFKADVGISATGVAGPGTQDGQPVGTIFVGAVFDGETRTRKVRGYGDRDNIRSIAATSAMDLARRLILEHDGDR